MDNPFADARLQLDHTIRRIREFDQTAQGVWSIASSPAAGDLARYRLQLHNERIAAMKPLVAEVVNGLRHSLDLLMSAAATITLGAEEAEKKRLKIKFPFPAKDGSIDDELEKQRPYIAERFKKAIDTVFSKHRHYHYYFRVVREASNNSKHQRLEPVAANALAVGLLVKGQQPKFTSIPKDHFLAGKPFEWDGPASSKVRFVTSLQFAEFPAEPPNYPNPPATSSVFSTTECYVRDMIGEFTAKETRAP